MSVLLTFWVSIYRTREPVSRETDLMDRFSIGTVEKIRSQRAHSIQMPDQYLFCHTAILECAVAAGLLQGDELASLDDEDDSSDTG